MNIYVEMLVAFAAVVVILIAISRAFKVDRVVSICYFDIIVYLGSKEVVYSCSTVFFGELTADSFELMKKHVGDKAVEMSKINPDYLVVSTLIKDVKVMRLSPE